MRKPLSATLATLLSAGTALALSVGLGATPVVAATATWTVTPGGNFYTNQPGQSVYLTDVSTGTLFRCDSGFSVSGQFKSGSGLTNPIGTVKAATAPVLCGAGGNKQFYVAFGNLPWGIRAMRYDATAGQTFGQFTKVDATLSAPASDPACSGVIDGTAPGASDGAMGFRYLNDGAFHTRSAGTSLHFYNVSGCSGIINSGDSIVFWAYGVLYAKGGSGMTPNIITSP